MPVALHILSKRWRSSSP